jgi:hypothetical protein
LSGSGSLIRSLSEPERSLRNIALDATPSSIEKPEALLRYRATLMGEALKQLPRLGEPLYSGLFIPCDRLRVVLRDASAGFVKTSEFGLRHLVALVGSLPKPVGRLAGVHCDSAARQMQTAERGLRVRIPLACLEE